MKNDIVGSLGIMLIATILLLVVGGSSEQYFWNGANFNFGNNNGSATQNVSNEPLEKPEKNEALFPKMADNTIKKYGRKWTVQKDYVDAIYWLDGTYLRAQGLVIAQAYQLEATEAKKYLTWQKNQLRKFGFKERKIKKEECKIVDTSIFSECLTAFERGEEKCLVLASYPTFGNEGQQPKNVQLKLLCGFRQ